jgi:putative protease
MGLQAPELIISSGSLAEVEKVLAAGADAVTVGDERYALRAPGHFDLAMIGEAVQMAHAQGKKVYVLVNALLHHEHLDGLEQYLQQLAEKKVDAIVFGDPAVFMTAKRVAPELGLHWNTETTSTNYRTVQFWAKRGAKRALLARELSLVEVLDIKRNSPIPIQVQVHGMTCIFHSKRELVSNYLRFQQREEEWTEPLFLKEHVRKEQQYPIFEDQHGTHVMSNEDICMLEHLGQLIENQVDCFYIEGIRKSIDYNAQVVSIYRRAIDALLQDPQAPIDPSLLAQLQGIQPANRPLSTGFYFKEQIY